MKKTVKFLLPVLLIIIIFAILIVLGIIPNPFLDTKDLVCTRGTILEAITSTKKTIKFKWNGDIKEINSKETYTYDEEEQAIDYFNSLKKSIGEDWEKYIILEKNKVVINSKDPISLDVKEMSKKQIKNKYKENGYECE